MRSKTAKRIHDETPQEVKDKVREHADAQVKSHQTMTDKQKAEEAWSDYTYSFNAITAIGEFKSALQKDIENEIQNPLPMYPAYTKGLERALELLNTTLPTKEWKH